jgi:3',5'-cyclic AMP phosphodiesterase CpdA
MLSSTFSIAHFSDLHFGRIHGDVLKDLEKYLNDHRDLSMIILTGDLTQRAKKEQFIAAKEFLEKIKIPVFIVPGNHDVPLYNLFLRFFSPYSRYRKYMGNLVNNFYEDDKMAIFGFWTVNPYKVADGRISESDIIEATEKFKNVSEKKIKILAAHHPVATYEGDKGKRLYEKLLALKPDFLLWGHDHQSSVKYHDEKTKAFPLMLASGTTFSSRVREEANSFNIITVNGADITITTMVHASKSGFLAERAFSAVIERAL